MNIIFNDKDKLIKYVQGIQSGSAIDSNVLPIPVKTPGCDDDIVIYTGYYENEIKDKIDILKQYKNIVVKFGRYIPNDTEHYDSVLGINLANKEQYGKKIS